jgi:hypothetical protein
MSWEASPRTKSPFWIVFPNSVSVVKYTRVLLLIVCKLESDRWSIFSQFPLLAFFKAMIYRLLTQVSYLMLLQLAHDKYTMAERY